MKKSLLVVVALLCMASLMAAMAFTSATVSSGMSYNIVNANEALLALTASDEHNAAFYNTAGADKLVIDLDKGYNNGDFGIQNNSTYIWDDLYKVTNNSEQKIEVTINTSEKSFAGIKTYVRHGENAFEKINAMYGSENIDGYQLQLDPGEEAWIDLKLESMQGSNKHEREDTMQLIVDAVKVED